MAKESLPIWFESSILKITKEGEQVLSSILEKGEKLISGATYDDLSKGDFQAGRDLAYRSAGLDNAGDDGHVLTTDPSGVNTVLADAKGNIVEPEAPILEPAADAPVVAATLAEDTVSTTTAQVQPGKLLPETEK